MIIRRHRWYLSLSCFLLCLQFTFSCPVRAEIDTSLLFGSPGSVPMAKFDYGILTFDGSSGNGPEDFDLLEQSAALQAGMYRTDTSHFSLTTDFQWLGSMSNDNQFPASGLATPTDLYDVSFGMNWQSEFGDGAGAGVALQLGSAAPSGDLFNSEDEMYISTVSYLRFAGSGRSGFIALLDVDTKRDLPALPGIGYQFDLGRNGYGAIGLPFAQLELGKVDPVLFEFRYRLERNFETRILLNVDPVFKPFVAYEWVEQLFMRADRAEDDERIGYEDMRGTGGLRIDASEFLRFTLEGGLSFEREFGEGEDRSDREDNNFNPKNAWFLGARFELELQ